MKTLVTGSAGFIGYHLCKKLLQSKFTIFGVDNLNNYYDVNLKKNRIKELKNYKRFHFNIIDIVDKKKLNNFVKKIK